MLKTREEMEKRYEFDDVHLTNEISTEFLMAKGARIQGVKNIENSMKKDLSLEKEQTKEEIEEDKMHERFE